MNILISFAIYQNKKEKCNLCQPFSKFITIHNNSLQLIPPFTDCLQVPVGYFVITYGLALNRALEVIQQFINGFLKSTKDFVNQTFSGQETLARAVQQADKTLTKLYNVLELGADSLASDHPDDQVYCHH